MSIFKSIFKLIWKQEEKKPTGNIDKGPPPPPGKRLKRGEQWSRPDYGHYNEIKNL